MSLNVSIHTRISCCSTLAMYSTKVAYAWSFLYPCSKSSPCLSCSSHRGTHLGESQVVLSYQVSSVKLSLYLQCGITIKIVQSVSYQCVFNDITGALLLQKKHCLRLYIDLYSWTLAGSLNQLQTQGCSSHVSQLLELNAQRALQCHHIVAISLLMLKPCRRNHLSVALCDPLLNRFHRYPWLLCWWNFVRASCTLLSRHFVHTRTRLIGYMV